MPPASPAFQTALARDAPALTPEDIAALHDLYVRGTLPNTLRALESDLRYIVAWRTISFGAPPAWPERGEVALRFLLDHARDLDATAPDDRARQTAEALVAAGLRRTLAAPAPATLDRRIASWRAFHRMRDLPSPFEAPGLRDARAKARRAMARPVLRKSPTPITREVLQALLDAAGPGLRGLRDRAILATGFASGGRRRSELAALDRADLDLSGIDADGLVRLRLMGTKTTDAARTPPLLIKGIAARLLVVWLDAGAIAEGPVFRRISKADRVLAQGLSGAGIGGIVKRLAREAGLDPAAISAHGLRSGFLSQASLDGVPLQAAMRLSLHRSPAQAMRYYDDVELAANPATDLLRPPGHVPDAS